MNRGQPSSNLCYACTAVIFVFDNFLTLGQQHLCARCKFEKHSAWDKFLLENGEVAFHEANPDQEENILLSLELESSEDGEDEEQYDFDFSFETGHLQYEEQQAHETEVDYIDEPEPVSDTDSMPALELVTVPDPRTIDWEEDELDPQFDARNFPHLADYDGVERMPLLTDYVDEQLIPELTSERRSYTFHSPDRK